MAGKCPHCGHDLDPFAKRCYNCGHDFEEDAKRFDGSGLSGCISLIGGLFLGGAVLCCISSKFLLSIVLFILTILCFIVSVKNHNS